MKDNIPGTCTSMLVAGQLSVLRIRIRIKYSLFSYSTLFTGHQNAWYGELDILICPLMTGTFINTSFPVQEKASAQFILLI